MGLTKQTVVERLVPTYDLAGNVTGMTAVVVDQFHDEETPGLPPAERRRVVEVWAKVEEPTRTALVAAVESLRPGNGAVARE